MLSDKSMNAASQLFVVHASSAPKDDLILLDAAGKQLNMLTATKEGEDQQARRYVNSSTQVESSPVTLMPMRLDVDALTDMVLLRGGTTSQSLVMTGYRGSEAALLGSGAPDPNDLNDTFVVFNTNDSGRGIVASGD